MAIVVRFVHLTAQVRIKFKNLRTYFLTKYQEIQKTPSWSVGSSGRKWPLYDCAAYLIDSLAHQTPTESSSLLPASGMVSCHINFQYNLRNVFLGVSLYLFISLGYLENQKLHEANWACTVDLHGATLSWCTQIVVFPGLTSSFCCMVHP